MSVKATNDGPECYLVYTYSIWIFISHLIIILEHKAHYIFNLLRNKQNPQASYSSGIEDPDSCIACCWTL